MARARSPGNLIDEAYRRSDNLGATDRHPRASVLRHLNQGGCELWDMLIEARGADYFRADPADTITTTASTRAYALEATFYMLISVRLDGDAGSPLVPFTAQEEPALLAVSASSDGYPTHYQLRRGAAGASTIAILPEHAAGHTLIVEYVPAYVDMTDESASTFDGINGWEDYLIDYAAKQMATQDEEWAVAKACQDNMDRMRARIMRLAPRRDMYRARRVTDVRGGRVPSRLWGWRR